jgi:magnesium transporter
LSHSLENNPETSEGCKVVTVAFDFSTKKEQTITLSEAKAWMNDNHFVWADIDVDNANSARSVLASLGLVADEIIEDALTREPATQSAKYEDYIHVVLSGCRLTERHFDLERCDIIVGEKFLLTIHRGSPIFLNAVKKHFRSDFYRFAKSPSFLVYELWDHLIDNYLSVQKRFEERVEKLQAELIGEVDDNVFGRISEIGADLLHFRKVLLPARAVLSELSSRKTLFISEATQPFLANMAGTIERVLQDLLVDRDILSESLNLYMSRTSHRTNLVMSKLTFVSVIFLPLTFLCGVYGMNFDVLPELHWKYGYLFFWMLVLVIVGGLVAFMRKNRFL